MRRSCGGRPNPATTSPPAMSVSAFCRTPPAPLPAPFANVPSASHGVGGGDELLEEELDELVVPEELEFLACATGIGAHNAPSKSRVAPSQPKHAAADWHVLLLDPHCPQCPPRTRREAAVSRKPGRSVAKHHPQHGRPQWPALVVHEHLRSRLSLKGRRRISLPGQTANHLILLRAAALQGATSSASRACFGWDRRRGSTSESRACEWEAATQPTSHPRTDVPTTQ